MELLDDKTLTEVVSIREAAPHPGSLVCAARAGQIEPVSAVFGRLPDEELMKLVAGNDPDAFALLYRRHARAAVALAMQMCQRRAIAEEVVQEAFLSLWRSRRHFDPTRGSVRTWTLGIVRNRAIDFLRRNLAYEVGEAGDQAAAESLEACENTAGEVGRRERAREILIALSGLPPEQSRVITLAYYGGYSHTEIATMLDTPIGTIKGRIRLGLRKMAGVVPGPS